MVPARHKGTTISWPIERVCKVQFVSSAEIVAVDEGSKG
jgi:hypothetical protein